MDKDEAIRRLKECDRLDTEGGHVEADDVLRELLISLGYKDVIDAYDEVPKWFA